MISMGLVGDDAFAYCAALTTVNISAHVETIGVRAFSECKSLSSFNIDEGNTEYSSVDGVLFNRDKTQLCQYPAGKADTAYTVPSSVTFISAGAFMGCKALVSVVLPDSISIINDTLFHGCTSLTTVNIPSATQKIGAAAFYECTSLTSITLPNKVQVIEASAFTKCTSLTSIEIPDSVTELGDQAFDLCSKLVTVKLSENITSIGEHMFDTCTSLTSIVIPSKVESIGESAFEKCTSLTTVKISASVCSIDESAFNYCTGLKEFDVDKDNEYFSSEKGVLFDKGKTKLLLYPSLKEDSEYLIPDTVKEIAKDAFLRCIFLKAINVSEDSEFCSENGVLYDSDKTTLLAYPAGKTETSYVMPKTLVNVPSDTVFEGCCLTEITLSDHFPRERIAVLGLCSTLAKVNVNESSTDFKSLDGVLFSADCKSILFCPAGKTGEYVIPEGTETIATFAFMFSEHISAVIIPDSVVTIESGAFVGNDSSLLFDTGCKSLCKIVFGNGLKTVDTENSFLGITFYADGKVLKATADNLNGKTFSVYDGTLSTGFDHTVPSDDDSFGHMEAIVAVSLVIVVILSFVILYMGRTKKD